MPGLIEASSLTFTGTESGINSPNPIMAEAERTVPMATRAAEPTPPGLAAMLAGYAHLSTIDQNSAPPQAADMERPWMDRTEKRPELRYPLDALRRGTP